MRSASNYKNDNNSSHWPTNNGAVLIGDLNNKRSKHDWVTPDLAEYQSNDQFQPVHLRIRRPTQREIRVPNEQPKGNFGSDRALNQRSN